MKAYIISVVTAAIICAAAGILLPTTTAVGQITRLLGGILLLATAISPLMNISFSQMSDFMNCISVDANSWVAEGGLIAQTEIDSIIKEKTEAYILDKANQMGLQIAVEVVLDENNHSIPSSVVVTGSLSPYAKEVLSEYIANTLDIAKEKQKWKSKT